MTLQPLWALAAFKFSNLFWVGRTPGQVIGSSQSFYLNIGQHKHRKYPCTHQTSIPWMGFEPTIIASERAKAVHALDRAATVPARSILGTDMSPTMLSLPSCWDILLDFGLLWHMFWLLVGHQQVHLFVIWSIVHVHKIYHLGHSESS
jgi:hypothetical protein